MRGVNCHRIIFYMPHRVHIGIDFGTSIVKVCYFYNESIEALVFDNLNLVNLQNY